MRSIRSACYVVVLRVRALGDGAVAMRGYLQRWFFAHAFQRILCCEKLSEFRSVFFAILYSSNKIRKKPNEHLIIVCLNLIGL